MFWNWFALVCTVLDSCSPNSAYRHKFGSSVGVQFAGTITVNNNDTTSNLTESKEDAMLDDLLNSQMAVTNQSMSPPMKKFFGKFSRVCSKKKPGKVSAKKTKVAADTFGSDLVALATSISEDWVMAYLEGTSVCHQTIQLSGEPSQITPLSEFEKEAIGMYTSFAIYAEVNGYMKERRTDDRSMNAYIGIVKGALMKIRSGTQYPSQINGNQQPVQTLYRGFGKSRTDWTKTNVQYRIENFWSTSESRAAALSFLFRDRGMQPTLLEITSGLQFARPIAMFSCRPDELEFLFLPGPIFHAQSQRFEVVKIPDGSTVTVNVVTGVVTE